MPDQFLAIWAKLYANAKLSEAQIKANPMPHLQEMSKQVCEMRRAIDEALCAMSGADCMAMAEEAFPDMAPSIVETSLLRQRKAQDILSSAIKSQQES